MEKSKTMGEQANYDLNIYNRGADESTILPKEDYYDEWWLCPYQINGDMSGYGVGEECSEWNFKLTDEEAKTLTLGWGPELGGDYTGDPDFWLDKNSFLEMYKTIPPRVQRYLDNLPPY
jgi:hypothetical protein